MRISRKDYYVQGVKLCPNLLLTEEIFVYFYYAEQIIFSINLVNSLANGFLSHGSGFG